MVEPCAMSLDFPFSVGSRNFFFFSVSEGGKELCFCCVFCTRSREGNSGLHGTRFIIQVSTVGNNARYILVIMPDNKIFGL